MMANYATEVLFVLTPLGDEAVYVTAREDHRNEKSLAIEVPRYFGEEYVFVRKLVIDSGLTKDQAEQCRRIILTAYEQTGRVLLNEKDVPATLVA